MTRHVPGDEYRPDSRTADILKLSCMQQWQKAQLGLTPLATQRLFATSFTTETESSVVSQQTRCVSFKIRAWWAGKGVPQLTIID